MITTDLSLFYTQFHQDFWTEATCTSPHQDFDVLNKKDHAVYCDQQQPFFFFLSAEEASKPVYIWSFSAPGIPYTTSEGVQQI